MTKKKRESSEEAKADLRAAAVELIRERGPLAGFTLQDVARRAGVHRVQIYHYYPSKQALLREAIMELLTQQTPARAQVRKLPFVQRRLGMFDHFMAQPELVNLEALLALDGDEELVLLPEFPEALKNLARDVEEGSLPADADSVALHVTTSATYLGYCIFADALSRATKIERSELDPRVRAVLALMLEGISDGGTDVSVGGVTSSDARE